MTLGDTRLTRTSANTLTGERTEVTSGRGRALVGAAVRASRAWTATRAALITAFRWCGRTIRPAGALALAAATVGLVLGLAFGWVEAIVAGVAAIVLLALSVPFLFQSRTYDVHLALGHERIVAGHGVRATVTTVSYTHLTLPTNREV